MNRSNLYGESQIIVGDSTTHGGVVLTGSQTNNWHGVPIVRKGADVFCPRCPPHLFKVSEGLENCTDTDAALPMATEGHLTTCGAALIAHVSPMPLRKASAIAGALLNGTSFDEQTKLSHNEIEGIPYFIRTKMALNTKVE